MNISNLLQNKLLLQYLAGAGADISAGQPIGQNVNLITQQNIAAQNFMGLLAKMLKGEVPEGGKVTIDNKGTKITVPKESTTMPAPLRSAIEGSQLPGGSGIDWTDPRNLSKLGVLNPSASPAIGGAELAGLTPANISQALTGAISVEALKQKKLTDLVDMAYRRALTEQALANVEKARKPEALDQPFVGGLTLRQFNALTPDAKEYVLAKHGARILGDTDFMPKREWDETSPTEKKKFLTELAEDPRLLDLQKELLEAGRNVISIGEKAETAAAVRGAVENVKAKKYFADPKGLARDVDRYINSNEARDQIIRYSDPHKIEVETIRLKEKFIRSRIASAGGTIVDERLEGRTFVFTVKWPDGTTSEVRYAN